MIRNSKRVFWFLLVLTFFLVVIDLPEQYRLNFHVGSLRVDRVINPPIIDINLFGIKMRKELKTRLGLDLSGGTHVVLDAAMKDIDKNDRASALESTKQVIERRVNFFGVAEPVVQTAIGDNHYRIIVELPGVGDVAQALALIGQTARLEFREFTDPTAATGAAFVFPTLENTASVQITGKDLKRAGLSFSSRTGEPEVALEFTPDGTKKFSEATRRLVGKQLAIFLDDLPLTWPRVNTEIADGRAVITGSFTRDAARTLALQLNAGALPVPVAVVEKRTVEATLGQESVQQSIRAGLIGLVVVGSFMLLQYGALGVFAIMALVVYGLLSFATIRLLGITLTLPGVAGFILSVGMAVDSNILIFERYKEELRSGKPWQIAMEQGFGKAWDSIRDANFTTIITALILFNPGNWQLLPSSGLVRGFAATLLIGVVTSLFTGIVVTRTFMRVLYKPKRGIL